MAGFLRYTVVLDACVLYPAPLRDLLLSLAAAGMYGARWTDRIQEDWQRNLLKNRPELKDLVPRTAELMNEARKTALFADTSGLSIRWFCQIQMIAMCWQRQSPDMPMQSSPSI